MYAFMLHSKITSFNFSTGSFIDFNYSCEVDENRLNDNDVSQILPNEFRPENFRDEVTELVEYNLTSENGDELVTGMPETEFLS